MKDPDPVLTLTLKARKSKSLLLILFVCEEQPYVQTPVLYLAMPFLWYQCPFSGFLPNMNSLRPSTTSIWFFIKRFSVDERPYVQNSVYYLYSSLYILSVWWQVKIRDFIFFTGLLEQPFHFQLYRWLYTVIIRRN